MQEKTFKGFPLDVRGDVIGAFPSVNVIQQQTENAIKQLAEKTDQAIIGYCLKFNIDPDVLMKQKAEIELLQMKIEKMKCCENCKNHRFIGDCLECKIIDCNNFEKWEFRNE